MLFYDFSSYLKKSIKHSPCGTSISNECVLGNKS